ncbi:MAG: hypothetical protein HY075_12460 [Deltaproteobacteria bacterium]|nr:hypothetical protein [Deltaproteobacteria bacterium]
MLRESFSAMRTKWPASFDERAKSGFEASAPFFTHTKPQSRIVFHCWSSVESGAPRTQAQAFSPSLSTNAIVTPLESAPPAKLLILVFSGT